MGFKKKKDDEDQCPDGRVIAKFINNDGSKTFSICDNNDPSNSLLKKYNEYEFKLSKSKEEETDIPFEEYDFKVDSKGLQMVSNLSDLSFNDVASKSTILAIDKKTEIPLVQRIRIPYSKTLSEICQLAKRLRSRAIFIGRQLYFLRRNKKNYDLVSQFPELAKQILAFMENILDSPELYEELRVKMYINPSLKISKELYRKLKIFEFSTGLNKFLKFEDSFINLGKIYSQLSTQVLRNVASDWKSFNDTYKAWLSNPALLEEEPRIPSKNRKTNEFLLTFSGAFITNYSSENKYKSSIADRFINSRQPTRNSKKLKNYSSKYNNSSELMLPQKFLDNFPSSDPFPIIRTTIDIESIIEVKIVPKVIFFEVQIVYTGKKFEDLSLDNNKGYAIDIGVNNLIALVNNFGEQPTLIQEMSLKSINQWMNKRIGTLRSVQTQGMCFKKGDFLPETSEMKRIRRKRDAIIDDIFHKASRLVINSCLKNRVKNLAIGYNAGWKKVLTSSENKRMKLKDKQTFTYIPFLKLIEMIKYKAELVGIKIAIVKESYTSKCSAVDFEPIEHHDAYLGQRGITAKGKNKKKNIKAGESEYKQYIVRSLFRTKEGNTIHSDVNGSFNIGIKAFPNLFNSSTLSKEKMLMSPKVIHLYNYKKGTGLKSSKLKRFVKVSCPLT